MRVRALIIAAGLSFALATPVRAERSPLLVDTSQGFARFVLDVGNMPPPPAEIEYGVLVLHFAEPVDVDLEALRAGLGPYATILRQDADKKTLRVALRGPVRLKQTVIGRQLAIDLMPPRFKGEPPPFSGVSTPESQTTTAAAEESGPPSEARERAQIPRFGKPRPLILVPVHVGANPTFTRIVFDWPTKVGYAIDQGDDHVVIRFSDAARVDLSELRVDAPRHIRSARVETTNGALTVVVGIDQGLQVRDFRDGNQIAIDIAEKLPEAEEEAAAPPVQAITEQRKGSDAEAVLSDGTAVPETESPQAAAAAGPSAETTAAAPVAAAPEQTAEAEKPAENTVPEKPPSTSLEFVAVGNGADLVLPWTEPVAAAFFQRGETLWLVFDTKEPLPVNTPGPELTYLIGAVEESGGDGLRIIRIALKTDAHAEARLDGARWIVHLGERGSAEPQAVDAVREIEAGGKGRLRFVLSASGVHWIKDPAAGDYIVAATATGPVRAVSRTQRLVEAGTLETAHGLAIVPFTDDLQVALQGSDVVMSAAEGLALTPTEDIERNAQRSPIERLARPGFMNFVDWRRGGLAHFNQERLKLQAQITQADDSSRDLARLDLAQFYLANGFYAEALGMLEMMAKNDPRVANAAVYNAMKGVALYMMGRTVQAENTLAHASLARDADVWLWRGATAAANGRWTAAARAFDYGGDQIALYPTPFAAQFRFAEAEAALGQSNIAVAEAALTALPETLDKRQQAEAAYLRGRVFETQGHKPQALAQYRYAAQAPLSYATARARLAEITLQEADGTMKRQDAIDALESLRFNWRGDAVECATLAKLGALYVAEKHYRQGLDTMRSAVNNFPALDQGRAVAANMGLVFRTLFLDGAAEDLSAVEALGLYYDYRELTPVGSEGDEMIRKLAERLVSVDLLAQAAELLQHQVDQRLQGAARSQVATRLAMIYLLDHKAEAALKTVRSTRQAQLPDWLMAQRRVLEARALAELKQYDFALEVLVSDESPEAERIRADVYWRAENWPAAAEHIEAVLANRWQDPKPLEGEDRLQVMRAAIAYMFGKDAFGLDRLRARYGMAMAASDDAAAFDLVTKRPDIESADLRSIVKRIASADTLDAFMAQYRKRYDTQGVAAAEATAKTKTN